MSKNAQIGSMTRPFRNYANWIMPGFMLLVMFWSAYEMWRLYSEVQQDQELIRREAVLEDAGHAANHTLFRFRFADTTMRLGAYGALHDQIVTQYGGSFNSGETYEVYLGSPDGPLVGLVFKEHTFFTLADYRKSQLQRIQEGPFTALLLSTGFFILLLLLVALIPTIVWRSKRRVREALLSIQGVTEQGDHTYTLTVNGFLVWLSHDIYIVLIRNGGINYVQAKIEVPQELSTQHYDKLVGRFEIENEAGKYYVLVNQRISFQLSTKKLLEKIEKQIEALKALKG